MKKVVTITDKVQAITTKTAYCRRYLLDNYLFKIAQKRT